MKLFLSIFSLRAKKHVTKDFSPRLSIQKRVSSLGDMKTDRWVSLSTSLSYLHVSSVQKRVSSLLQDIKTNKWVSLSTSLSHLHVSLPFFSVLLVYIFFLFFFYLMRCADVHQTLSLFSITKFIWFYKHVSLADDLSILLSFNEK